MVEHFDHENTFYLEVTVLILYLYILAVIFNTLLHFVEQSELSVHLAFLFCI